MKLKQFRQQAISMKYRLWILLIVSSALPLALIWIFTSYRVYDLYQLNTNMIIRNELSQIKGNMDILMDSMKYMSQQLSSDEKTLRSLRENLGEINDVQRYNNLKFLRDQIVVYEASNPNISNITYFYRNDDGTVRKINTTSLAREQLPKEEYRLSTQNQITYYGPHNTLSVVSNYPVLSLLRRLNIPDYPGLYLYIESGYKQMGDFAAQTLDHLGAVYTVVSDGGRVIYSSQKELVPVFSEVPAGESESRIKGQRFLTYQIHSLSGWSLRVFVPGDAYNRYMEQLSLGFILIAVLAVGISLVAAGFIWNSVNRPLHLFERNLKNIMTDDIEANVRTIHVKEFDQNFEYFEKMKRRIVSLVQTAQRQEQEKSQLEIKQMLSKINPHFIHNTLDTLKWYAAEQNYPDVESFVSSLNKLLMYNMEKEKITTLESELSAVDNYILLQKLKYELDYRKEIDLSDAMLQTEMPRFLLQPLVENAIFHGLEGKGRIGIRVGLLPSGKISIQVVNNGYPLNLEKIGDILRSAEDLSSNGIGLQYVMRMLEAKFPNAYEFHVRTENGENLAEIIIPFNKGEYYAKSADR